MKIDLRLALLLAFGLVAATTATAQAPDCTGVSTVFNTNPNFVGELTTVPLGDGTDVLNRPLLALSPPGDTERLFFVEQGGLIRIFKNGVLLDGAGEEFLDVSAITRQCGGNCEQGLLGMAFDPDYATNRYFYIYHTNSAGNTEIVARYETLVANPDKADATSRVVVLSLGTVFSNHNGGHIAFSPVDGYLYIATGDGGGACDGGNRAQTLSDPLGKMLRIDVSSLPYSTAGNPFDGHPTNAEEVWAWGLRNPYRWSFDRTTGAIYYGDVGQNAVEEISCEPASTHSSNYGWKIHEGNICPACGVSGTLCNPTGYSPPLLDYNPPGAAATVIGGYVYRGCRMPELHGTYFYADFYLITGSDEIESFRTDATCGFSTRLGRSGELNGAGQGISKVAGFGEDGQGEVYVVDRGLGTTDGQILKVLPILDVMETSGAGAENLLLGATDWTWEDLEASSGHPISNYRVYRAGAANGSFACEKRLNINKWAGGDPDVPLSGEIFFYAVTALGTSGQTTLGFGSAGMPRNTTPSICL